jgi:hypothetical protein
MIGDLPRASFLAFQILWREVANLASLLVCSLLIFPQLSGWHPMFVANARLIRALLIVLLLMPKESWQVVNGSHAA